MATPPSSAVQQHATSPPRWTARSLRGSGPDRHVRTPGRGVARQGAPTGGSSCWLVVVGAPPSTTNGLATGASATPRPPSRRVARHEVAPMAPLCPGSRCRGSIAPGRTPPPSTWRSQREDVGVPVERPGRGTTDEAGARPGSGASGRCSRGKRHGQCTKGGARLRCCCCGLSAWDSRLPLLAC